MRHAASQLRSKAERTAAVLGRVDGQVSSMTFAGPAADQFRAVMGYERYRLGEIARILGQAADTLNDAANRVEADPLGFYGR